jgi:rRNA small subunit pseudouridine methyltransferase Nep1
VHLFLLLCLDSILNAKGDLRTIVHTRNNEMITVAPETRIPKHYTRFVGLMEEMFEKGRVPAEGTPLLTLDGGKNLKVVLEELGGKSVALDPGGKLVDLSEFFGKEKGDMTVVIGGFPHGGFNSPVKDLCEETISIHENPLKVWTVTAEVLVSYRQDTDVKR